MKNRVLVYGLHGFRNIGAEARLVSMVTALQRLVPQAEIVVNTLHRTALDYLSDRATVHYFHPVRYRTAGPRLIASADLMVLSEGAFIGETFSPHLSIALTSAIEQARRAGVGSVGLALDSGYISPGRQAKVVAALEELSLLTLRSAGAEDELRDYGVTRDMPVTADCALSMPAPSAADAARVHQRYALDGEGAVHALFPVDFYMWPLRIRPFGRPHDYVRWPFKGAWTGETRRRSRELADQWVAYGRYLLGSSPGARVALVVQERGDRHFVDRIWRQLGSDRAIVVNGQDMTPGEVSSALSHMSSITSSRYHGVVMSLPYAIPFQAVGHDQRASFLCRDLGVDHFVRFDEPGLADRLAAGHEAQMQESEDLRVRLKTGVDELVVKDQENYRLLGEELRRVGFEVSDEVDAATEEGGASR